MEDFSPRQSPRVKDYLLTQTTNASPARLNTHGSTYSGYGSNIPTDHPSYIELKRDYSKALNTIEILRLEKSNLETALKYAKRSRPGDSLAGSYASTGRRSPDRREYRSDHHYAEVERRIYDLKQELEEHKKLLADNYLYTENLKREAHSHHSRMQEIDDLQSRNYLMKDEMNILTRELQAMTNRVADLEEERHQLLEKISADGQQRFPPRGIYKYVDYIHNAVDALPTNHHAYYHFQECFPDNENMEVLIEEKDSNTLILQTMKYLTNLLVNLSSNPTTLPSTLPVSSDSKGYSLNLMDKVTPRIPGEASTLNQSVLNTSKNQRITPEQAPTRKESSNNVSRSVTRHQQVEEEEAPVPRSPSRLNLSHMSNHTRKKSLGNGTTTAKAGHNTQPSFGDGVRQNAGTTTPNHNQNLSQRSLQKAGTPTNRSNISMNRTNRPKTNLDVSQRNNSQIGTLNRSGYSSGSPKADRKPSTSNQRSVLNVQPAADVSHVSQNRSQNRSRSRIDASPQMLSEQINGVQYERELLERENRLRDLDRELAEKERLLQSRENHQERYPTEAGTAGFGTQVSTNEEAYHSNSRYIDHHKSIASSKPAQANLRSNNDLNNRSHISNNPSRNQSIRQDTREALDRSNLRDNLNQSHHSAIPNRVIPSITTITDFDGSPKAGQTPHSRQDPTRKAISPFVFSNDNLDAVNEQDRASRSPAVGKCRIQSKPSIPDETTPIPANNRVSFQVYSQAGNSPYSRASGWPQSQTKLDQSPTNRSNIRIRDEYHTSHLIDQPAQRPSEYVDHQDDDMRRKITFEQQQLDDDEEEQDIGEDYQQDEEIVSPNHQSLRARRQRGTEYASFRVSFGRTESKDMRNGSPPPDQKGSLFVFDIPKRKRVTHNEQTYDIVKGKTVNYKLKSEGKDYQVNLAKSRTGTRTSTCSDFNSVLSDKLNSPTPSVPIENFKEAL